jgi:hypothetical protein
VNFIRYDESNGEIINIGWMDQEFVDQEISDGKPTIQCNEYIEVEKWKVNLSTKQLEPKE